MTGTTSDSNVVVATGDRSAPEIEGFDVETVDPGGLPAAAARADCVVATVPGGGLDALESVAGTAVPTVLYDRTGDPSVAARATRLGVTEYVTDGALDGATLADRIRVVTGADRARAAGALESLHAVATDRSLTLEEKTDRLLEVGRERLDLGLGVLAEIDGETATPIAVSGTDPAVAVDDDVPLAETFCRRTVDVDGLFGVTDVETVHGDDPAAAATGFGCYLGGTVVVDGEPYGTVYFADEDPRDRPFSARERRFVELLVEWLSHEVERGRRERALGRYKAIHETVEEMVFVVSEGTTIEQVTEPLVERFGYDREELLGTSITEFLDETSVEEGYEAFHELRDGAESVTMETTISTADDNPVPVEVDLSLLSASTDFRGLVGVVRDRTALSETRAELAAQRDRFQSLFDQLPDAVVDTRFVDGEPHVRAVNPAFEEVFGYDAEDVVDESVNDLIVPEELRGSARQVDKTAMVEGYDVGEVERMAADGRRTFLFRGFIYDREGPDELGFGIYTDMTERIEQKRRLRVLHRVLRHNLRNEMTGIIGFAQLLAEEATDPDHREFAERIHRQADDVAKLGEQVQRIERALDQDRHRFPMDPGEVAHDVAERFRERHPEATVEVDADCGRVVADALLELAVENLVENAIEHHDGTPTVEVAVRAVDDEWVELTVRDDGPGIPEREQAVVGGEREITQLDHSRGLGLWLARWIVEGVGGDLRFEGVEDGAEVSLRLQRLAERDSA